MKHTAMMWCNKKGYLRTVAVLKLKAERIIGQRLAVSYLCPKDKTSTCVLEQSRDRSQVPLSWVQRLILILSIILSLSMCVGVKTKLYSKIRSLSSFGIYVHTITISTGSASMCTLSLSAQDRHPCAHYHYQHRIGIYVHYQHRTLGFDRWPSFKAIRCLPQCVYEHVSWCQSFAVQHVTLCSNKLWSLMKSSPCRNCITTTCL